MKIFLEINNQTKFKFDKPLLKKVADKVLKFEKGRRLKLKKNAKLEISLVFVSSGEIKRLNRIYRKKNKVTDILTFAGSQLNEIIICPQQIRKNTKKFKTNFNNLLIRFVVHGMLHLLGYNHEGRGKKFRKDEKIMNNFEQKILEQF